MGAGANASEHAALQAVTQRLRAFPRKIGRYLIQQRLGQGGMGAVFAGWDPELDRRVAIKLLAPSVRVTDTARLRMLREAQALAAISHPSVVSIYEVGVHEGLPFIAMEHVEAPTLRRWLRERPQWRDVLEVFLSAAAGLDAAHGRGIVHRDFKPSNAMVEAGGRVRVVDFGLARIAAFEEEEAPTDPAMDLSATQSVTMTGAVVGTPAYMAPEQHLGAVVGPAADQYAFCVVLWEALFGIHPWYSASSQALLGEIRDARPRKGTTPPGLPGAVRRVLRRGMRLEPRRRYPSMRSLIRELRSAARLPSGRSWAVAGGGLGLGLCGLAIAAVLGGALSPVQVEVAEAPTSVKAAATVRPLLDRARALNMSGRTEASASVAAEAVRVARNTGSPLLAEALLSEGRALSLGSQAERSTQVLREAHELALDGEDHYTAMMSALLMCQQLMAEKSQHEAALRWWRHAEAAALRQGLEAPPAWTALLLGNLYRRMGRYADARAEFEAVVVRLHGQEDITSQMDLSRAYRQLDRRADAIEAQARALALAEAAEGRDSFTHARVAYDLASMYAVAGRWPEAERALRSALQVFDRVLPTGHPKRVQVSLKLGLALLPQGQIDEAVRRIEAGVAALELRHEPGNMRVIDARTSLAEAYLAAERADEAEAVLDGLIPVIEASLGAKHLALGEASLLKGKAAAALGRGEEAQRFFRRAVQTYEAAGDRSPAYFEAKSLTD